MKVSACWSEFTEIDLETSFKKIGTERVLGLSPG